MSEDLDANVLVARRLVIRPATLSILCVEMSEFARTSPNAVNRLIYQLNWMPANTLKRNTVLFEA